jgi:hypothetical protein
MLENGKIIIEVFIMNMHATMVGYNMKRKFIFLPSISSPKNTHLLSIPFFIIVHVSPSFSLQLKINSFQSTIRYKLSTNLSIICYFYQIELNKTLNCDIA